MSTFTLEEFKKRIAGITNSTTELDEKMTLGEIGIDSLNILEVIVLLEEVSGGALDPGGLELNEFTTLGDLYQLGIGAAAATGPGFAETSGAPQPAVAAVD